MPSAKVYGPYYEKEKAAGLSPEEEAQRWKSQVKHLTSYLDEAMELSFTDLFVWGEKEAEDAFLSTLAEVTSLAVHNFPSSGFGMAAERFEQAHWKLDRQKILPLLGAAQKGSPPYYLDLQAGRDKEKWLPRRFIEPLTRALAAMTCVLAVFLFRLIFTLSMKKAASRAKAGDFPLERPAFSASEDGTKHPYFDRTSFRGGKTDAVLAHSFDGTGHKPSQ